MKLRNIFATLLLAGVTTIAVAAETEGALVVVPGQVMVVGARSVSATVTAIDPATRAITLTSAKGKVTELVAGPEVRNFAQIKVGDEVVAKAVDSLTLELKKGGGGVRQRVDTADAARTEVGEKPGVAAAEKTEVLADVTKVDRKSGIVTLKGVKHTMQLKINDPEQLKLIAVGDQVKGTFIQAVAVGVVPKAAK